MAALKDILAEQVRIKDELKRMETDDETTEEDEVGRIHDELIDLEPVVRDTLVLALPVNPVCRPDCPGLCPDCGVAWDDLPADHGHTTADPRWAALSALRDRNKDTEE